ncbi:hypothetical protein MAR_034521 [Mya arenaria]|uniref:Mutator-like transposase domain-containing protein n=1 Tax=Mya arenaria TaxID=6604 RepID=A0ABY7GEJ9_MYAAR|nr:hypothetical protein MAR_034521 [Mya arenaria]
MRNDKHEGVPAITVVCDDGWSKCTLKHTYNALGGVAVMIGSESKILLHIGIRKKQCIICSAAANKNVAPKKHDCYRNKSSTSQSMESDIILEGRERTWVRYMRMIADGDSSVNLKIVECVPKNLVIKGKEKLNSKYIVRITTAIRCAIRMRSQEQNAKQLKQDITNSSFHQHDFWKEPSENDMESARVAAKLAFKIDDLKFIIRDVSVNIKNIGAEKNDRLIGNLTTNLAENWMAIRAKFDGGKQIYRCQRCSWGLWGALRKPLGPAWSPMVFQEVTGCEPGSYFFNNARHPEKKISFMQEI